MFPLVLGNIDKIVSARMYQIILVLQPEKRKREKKKMLVMESVFDFNLLILMYCKWINILKKKK